MLRNKIPAHHTELASLPARVHRFKNRKTKVRFVRSKENLRNFLCRAISKLLKERKSYVFMFIAKWHEKLIFMFSHQLLQNGAQRGARPTRPSQAMLTWEMP